MSRHTSPKPVFKSTSAVPQQLTEDSAEIIPISMTSDPTGSIRIPVSAMYSNPQAQDPFSPPQLDPSRVSSIPSTLFGSNMPQSMGSIPVTLPPQSPSMGGIPTLLPGQMMTLPPQSASMGFSAPIGSIAATLPPQALSPPREVIPMSSSQFPTMSQSPSGLSQLDPSRIYGADPLSNSIQMPTYQDRPPLTQDSLMQTSTLRGSFRGAPPSIAEAAQAQDVNYYENTYTGPAYANRSGGFAYDNARDTVEGADSHTERFCECCGTCLSYFFHCLGRLCCGLKPEGDLERETKNQEPNIGGFFFFGGLFVSLMLIVIPVWDGFSLRNDPAWMYMEGGMLPNMLICFLLFPVFFMITVISLLVFGAKGGPNVKSEQTLLNVGILFVLLLGVMLLSVGEPLSTRALLAKNDFFPECETSLRTNPLFGEQNKLSKLREDPSCASKPSVEQCPGYEDNYHSRTLRDFENYFKCSGFCFHPNAKVAMDTKAPVAFVPKDVQITALKDKLKSQKAALKHLKSLSETMVNIPGSGWAALQLKIKFLEAELGQFKDMLDKADKSSPGVKSLLQVLLETDAPAAAETLSQAEVIAMAVKLLDEKNEAVTASLLPGALAEAKAILRGDPKPTKGTMFSNVTVFDKYPTTLFAPVQYVGSCSSMAGIDMYSYVNDMGRQLMWEGFFLIGLSIVSGLMIASGSGSGKKELRQKQLGYGAIAGPPTSQVYAPSQEMRYRSR